MQEKTDRLSQAATKLGLTPSTAEDPLQHTSNPILMHSTALEEVQTFTYPAGAVDTTGGTDADIKRQDQ